jgi:peptide/nickel transport system permease protein
MTEAAGRLRGLLDEERRERIRAVLAEVFENDMAKIGGVLLVGFALMGLVGPFVAPHDPGEHMTRADGSWAKSEPPSLEYPLGTTQSAYPIFTRLLFGARIALFTGGLTALLVGVGGSFAGIVAGYFGGNVETGIMRMVDFAYGVPFLPFAIVLVIVLGKSITNVVLAISLLLWRETARVVRSEVLTIRELPMIEAAEASGAGHGRIILYHVYPKVLPTTVLYSVFAVGWAILTEAGLAFLGFSDPNLISWGRMLQNAYISQALQTGSWFWIFPPGLCIMLLVLSIYLISQGIEEVVNPQLRER